MAAYVKMSVIFLGWITVYVCRNFHNTCVCTQCLCLPLYSQDYFRQVLGPFGLSLPIFTYVPFLLVCVKWICLCVPVMGKRQGREPFGRVWQFLGLWGSLELSKWVG